MPYPKEIKDFIYSITDYKKNRTLKVWRFVSYMTMLDGKPLERIFGFISDSNERTIQSMLVQEVARNYDHKQWLGDIYQCSFGGYKKVNYHKAKSSDWFGRVKYKWSFSAWWMVTPEQFLTKYDIKYSGWTEKSHLDFLEYMTNYMEYPKCELFMKAGLGYWTNYLKHLDLNKKALHEIFKIKQEAIPLLKRKDFGYKELMCCRKYGYTKMKQIRTRILIQYYTKKDPYTETTEESLTVNKVLKLDDTYKYLLKLYKKDGWVISDYRDYLKQLIRLGAIEDPKSLYPKDFVKAHKAATRKIKLNESKEMLKGFKESYSKYKKYEFKSDNLLIIAVSEPKQLYQESKALKHCVRTYDEEVAAGNTEIMFIRKKSDPNKPYYTLELKGKKVNQVRGKDNKNPRDNVVKFVRAWAKKFKLKYTAKQDEYYAFN